MDVESLLSELPENTLGYPLNSLCKIVLYFIIPSFCSLCFYTTLISTDFALVFIHIKEENPRWGVSTLLLMFAPSIAGFIFTLSSTSRWPSDLKVTKANLRFFGLNLWHLLLFPFAAMYRYIHQIFWSVEAICADYLHYYDRRENALRILFKPNSMEMYFFLQAYLHSAPQIFLQFYILFTETNEKSEIASLQVLSIVCGIFRMAITTMNYQRFERRKVLGAHYPWTSKRMLDTSKRLSMADSIRKQDATSETTSVYEPPVTGIRMLPIIEESYLQRDDDDEVFEEPIEKRLNENIYDSEVIEDDFIGAASSTSTLYEEPIAEEKKRVTIIESPVQVRKNPFDSDSLKDKVVDMSKHVTPPSTTAPRPMSIAGIKEKLVSNANAFVEQIPKRRYKDYDEIDLPVQRRRIIIKGVEQEDGISRFIAFTSWFLFIGARMLVLCTFAYFYMRALIYVCLAHYLLATAMLMWNSWTESLYRKCFYLFLGYVYIFCLIELKITFKKVRLWYGIFFSIIVVENFILTVIWFKTGEIDDWWFRYILIFTFMCSLMSFMCFLLYFLILKPKPVIIYRPPSQISERPEESLLISDTT